MSTLPSVEPSPTFRLLGLRHGISERNVIQQLVVGGGDSPLTEQGKEQVQETARWLANCQYQPHEIWASPLLRAQSSAKEACALLGMDEARIRTDERLSELHAGDLEGLLKAEVLTVEIKQQMATLGMDYQYPGEKGESMRICGIRSQQWLEERLAEWDGQTSRDILFISHGHASRALRALLFGVDPLSVWRLAPGDNASLTLLEYKKGTWHERCVNWLPHFPF